MEVFMALRLKPVAAAVAAAMAIGLAGAPAAIGQTTGSSSTPASSQRSNQSAAGTQDQTTSTGTQYSTQQGQSATQAGKDARAQNIQPSTRTASKQGQQAMVDMRASRIIGRDVHNAQGKELGEISDLVVDMNANRIQYAILQRGGVLGIGDKAYAIPVSRFTTSGDRRLTLNLSEDQIKGSPEIDRRADWNDARLWSNVGQYYHRTLGMPAAAQAGSGQRFQRASDVIGMEVMGANGDHVGEVEDLVVNVQDGSIHYAVLEFDREWNPNDKLVALPLSSFRPSNGNLLLNMTREQVAGAPSFERRDWPNMADTGFRNRVVGLGKDHGTLGMQQRGSALDALIVVIDEPEYLRLDTNRDGRLSREEVRTISELDRQWSQVDRDSDGFVTRHELRQFGNSSQAGSPTPAAGSSGSSMPGSSSTTTSATTSPTRQ
jgi:sporulation protein YlmC with PRC-barrel domain